MHAVRIAAILIKGGLLLLLVSALIWPDLSGIKEKAAAARFVVYPLGGLAVPLWWLCFRRQRPFPWAADVLVTLPWLLDLLGNRFDLFDSVAWWDDLMHFINWALLTAGVLVAWRPRRAVGPGLLLMVALGFGTTAAVLWELGEYAAFVRNSPEYATAYPDTLGDLTLGTAGAVVAGGVLAGLSRRSLTALPAAVPPSPSG